MGRIFSRQFFQWDNDDRARTRQRAKSPPRSLGIAGGYSRRLRIEPLEDRSLLSAVSWDGGGNGVFWTDPLNWSGDALPGANDDVTIDAPGALAVRLSTGTHTIHSLTIAADDSLTVTATGNLTVSAASAIAGAVTLSGASGGVTFNASTSLATLNLTSASLAGAGDVSITNALVWSGGSMSGTGKTVIASGATLQVTNVATTRTLGRLLQNDGLAQIGGTLNIVGATFLNNGNTSWSSGQLAMTGGVFQNNGSFVVQGSGSRSVSGQSGVNIFNNNGSLVNQGSAAVAFALAGSGVTFNSSGSLDGGVGGVTFNTGGSFADGAVIGGKRHLLVGVCLRRHDESARHVDDWRRLECCDAEGV